MVCGEHDPRELSTANLSAGASRFAFRQFTRAMFTTRHPKSDQNLYQNMVEMGEDDKLVVLSNAISC